MIFDINLAVGQWPFRGTRFQNGRELFAHLQKYGISGGLVRSFRAPFCGDLDEVNRELMAECAGENAFLPAPAVHPQYRTAWRSWNAPAAALYPGFQNIPLCSGEMVEMAQGLAAQGVVLLLVMREEDERSQQELCLIPKILPEEVNRFAALVPRAKICVINGYWAEVSALTAPNVFCDFSWCERCDTVKTLLEKFSAERLLFGSDTPMFYTSAALAKLRDAALAPELENRILTQNARALFGGEI